MHNSPGPKNNLIIKALPPEEVARWIDRLERVEVQTGRVLYEPGAVRHHVFFPIDSIVSLLQVTETDASAEVAVVGNEGIVGFPVFSGGSTASLAIVQSVGHGYRLKSHIVKETISHSIPTLTLLLRYTQALITQIAQTAVCNRHHSIEQQLCRWLLMILDRLRRNDIFMTQDLIARMLGVRRVSVTQIAHKLRKDGVIDYERGRIAVFDRKTLEARSCECYRVVKREYQHLLP